MPGRARTDDWRLAAITVLAGLATAGVMLLLWFWTLGGRRTTPDEYTAPAASAGARMSAQGLGDALGSNIAARLGQRPVPTRPLRGVARFVASDVVWRHPETGGRFGRARLIGGTLSMVSANAGDIVLGAVRLEGMELELRSDGRHWNYEAPLAGLLDPARATRPESGRQFRIASLQVSNGTVRVDLPQRDFTIRQLEARLADLRFAGPGLPAPRLDVITGQAVLAVEGRPREVAIETGSGHLSFPEKTTVFELASVTVAGTRIERASGTWDPGQPGYGVTATGVIAGAKLADLRPLSGDRLPAEGTASFRFSVAPLPGDGTRIELTDLAAISGDSRISGTLAAEVFPGHAAVERVALRLEPLALALLEPFTGPLPFHGTLTGSLTGPGSDIRLDLLGDLRQSDNTVPIQMRLQGGVALTQAGLEFKQLEAQLQQVPLSALRAYVPGLPLAGTASGVVRLAGAPGQAPLQLDVRLELGTGLVTLAGMIDLSGPEARYDLAGRLVGIELRSILARASPPVGLTARFSLVGQGLTPETARATAKVQGEFTGWRAEAGDRISVVAAVDRGRLQVDTMVASLAGATLTGRGGWRFIEPVSGAAEYRLTVASLGPFAPYIPVIGDSAAAGELRAEGSVSGPLRALRLDGSIAGTDLRIGEWQARHLSAGYTLVRDPAVPDLQLRLRGEEIATPGAGSYRVLDADVRLRTPDFTLDVRGEQAGGGEVAVVAEGALPREGERLLTLQRAHLDLPEGRWELSAPARVSWGSGAGVRVSTLELRNARTTGRLSLEGTVFPLSQFDAHLMVADLPLDELQDLLGRQTGIRGRLTADLTVRPPAAAPTINGSFRLDRATLNGVKLSELRGRLDYEAGQARGELTAAFDSAAGQLQLRGTLPLRISLADSLQFGLAASGPLDATFTASRVSLRPLGLLVQRVSDLDGVLDGTVVLQGTAESPLLNGALALSRGRLKVPELNQTFDSIAGVVAFEGRRAEVHNLAVHRNGWARLNGTVVFEELNRPTLALTATLEGLEPIGVEDHPDAEITGQVELNGELSSLVLTGDVLVDDGYVAVPQIGRAYRPEYQAVIDPTPVLGRELSGESGPGWFSGLRIDGLRARFGEGAWVEAADATLQLRGAVTLNRRGDATEVTGTLEGERGTYTLMAGPIVRRFEITRAEVRFLGGREMNPVIDATARRIVLDAAGRRVEVEVRITGTAEAPRLSLASADAPNIPQSELLSFLLFGRPSFALGQDVATTGEAVFEQTFFGGFAELASAGLEQALSSDLGLQLDVFQVRFGQGFGGLATPTFVVGRQLSEDFFLTVESGLNALFGESGGAANTWAIRMDWALAPSQTLQFGIEPVNRARLLRGVGAALPPGRPTPQQLYAEYRRRWVY